MLVHVSTKCGRKPRQNSGLNSINLPVIQLWQVSLIMQHKGKTNRVYLHGWLLFIIPTAISKQITAGLTGATDSLSWHVEMQITIIYHVWCGSANILVSVLCIQISKSGKLLSPLWFMAHCTGFFCNNASKEQLWKDCAPLGFQSFFLLLYICAPLPFLLGIVEI